MENFNNYQQVINALKAEYVNARNLKRVANTARRATINAASFKNRKENEKTTLENRVDSIETALNSTLSNAISEADLKKWADLKSKLSELKGKLEHIENEEYLLVRSFDVAPWDYSEVSDIDSNSFTMLKNLLTTAISDAEIAINNAYGEDYYDIQQSTKFRYSDKKFTDSELMSKHSEKKAVLDGLFQKAEDAITEYTEDMFDKANTVNILFNDCVDLSTSLAGAKEYLANLLVSGGAQSYIDDAEEDIESYKSQMINRAHELKLAKEKLIEWTVARFNIVAEYIEDARDYANQEYYDFVDDNSQLLRDEVAGRPEYLDWRTTKLYYSLFDSLATSSNIQGLNLNEFNEIQSQLDSVRTDLFNVDNRVVKNSQRIGILQNPNSMIIENNGKFEFSSDFHTSDIIFYKEHNAALNSATSEYITQNVTRNFRKSEVRDLFFIKSGIALEKALNITGSIREAKFVLRRANKELIWSTEYYTGTQEQQSEYNNFISEHNPDFQLFNQSEQSYHYNNAIYQFNLGIFENEFNLLNTLAATKTSTEDYISSLTSLEAGVIDQSFAYGNGFNALIFSTAIQSDGKILVGGQFADYNGIGANGITRLNTDGSIDTSFVYGTGFNNFVQSIAIQSDGKILVGGSFTTYNGTSANNIIRLNSDGSIDTSFVYGTGFNLEVESIAIQSDGKILVGGGFTNYNGTSANYIIRLNTDGSVDTSFVYGTGFNAKVKSIDIQSDGKVLFGGQFTTYNGTGAYRIIRLNSDGSVDTSFVYGTGFDSTVYSMAIQSDGKIVVAGYFTGYNGIGANGITRLNTDGSIDTSFVYGTGFNGGALSIAIQSDGKIVVGGDFSSYNGTSANNIIRLNSDGSIDTSFVYGTGFNFYIFSIAIQSNGNILAGGQFTTYNGVSASKIVSLNSITVFESDEAEAAYPEALISRNAAVEQYNLFLDTELGEKLFEENWNGNGRSLLDIKRTYDNSYANYTAAEAAWNAALAEFEVLKSQMTLGEPSEWSKRQAIKIGTFVSLAEDRLSNLETLKSGHGSYLNSLKARIINLMLDVLSVTDEQFAENQHSILNNAVKDFLENANNNNKLAISIVEKLHTESIKTTCEDRLLAMSYGFNNTYEIPYRTSGLFSSDQGQQLGILTDGSLRVHYATSLLNIINTKVLRFNPDSFADAIIAEATNGTPLVP
jgi:uncharacterized delta-60 repeat protein